MTRGHITQPSTRHDSTTVPPIAGVLQRTCACGKRIAAGGECDDCRKQRLRRQARRAPDTPGDAPSFGAEFSRVPASVDPRPALSVSQPGDRYEREAQRVAADVLRAAPFHIEQSVGSAAVALQRVCASCRSADEDIVRRGMAKALYGGSCESAPDEEYLAEEEEEEPEAPSLMAKSSAAGALTPAPGFVGRLAASRRSGRSLAAPVRAFMESRFGYDFSGVRLHTDRAADDMSRAVNAEAFTTGSDIYFRAGRYAPNTPVGTELLAHELTHVVQQRRDTLARRTIQRFTLNGFPPAEEAAMKAAIPAAVSTVSSCATLGRYGKNMIPRALDRVRYDYKPELGLCGWTFPSSWYIKVGKNAFDPAGCCDLPSTLAHEASHVVWYTEKRARKMECGCFGCSC